MRLEQLFSFAQYDSFVSVRILNSRGQRFCPTRSITMTDDLDEECPLVAAAIMNSGMESLFKSFIMQEDYDGAMDFAEDCFGFVPTSYVINQIIFKIMMNCQEKLAYKSADYLEVKMRAMLNYEDQKVILLKGLKDESGEIWDAFSHFVWSTLYNLQVPVAYCNAKDYIKSPNCLLLMDIYIKAFLKCSIKSDILGSRVEERLSALLKWINMYYKYNFGDQPELSYLHKLLDYIVDSEISGDKSLPLSVKIHTADLKQHMNLILNICKDVFATLQNQQRFFIYSNSHFLVLKICQHRLHELIDEKSQPPNSRMLTLKTIVDNYFFHHADSKRRSSRIRQMKKFSKDPIAGDRDFHLQCRLGRPADLLTILYGNKDEVKYINAKNCVGNTPLHEACLSSSYLCCKFLIEETGDVKVDFRATDTEGRTPLHCAVYVDALDIAKLLLSRGGNDQVKFYDNLGKKPIDYSSSDEMKKLLREVESKLEENNEESSKTSVVSPLKLPSLKNSKDYHLYLRTLRSLVSNYCDIYDLPKTENDAKILSHKNQECYHYKASGETLCLEDSATLDTIPDVINKFVSCAKLVSNEKSFEKELFHWKIFSAIFK